MKNELDFKMPGVQELGNKELITINGGNPIFIGIAIVTVGLMNVAYNLGKDIGRLWALSEK